MKNFLSLGLFVLTLTGCLQNEQPITVFLAGDSTVADKPYRDGNPEKGWGQVFPLYFMEGVRVENHAVNGRSTKSFIDEGRWQDLLNEVREGDYVFIEFGHNDSKIESEKRYAAAEGAYSDNLRRFVSDVRDREGIPVLLTPIVRRRFDEQGVFYDTHEGYPDAVRKVAAELDVVLIDLHKSTWQMLVDFGPEASKKLFLHIDTTEYGNLKQALADDTHLSPYGAFKVADLVAADLKKFIPKLAGFLKK